MDLSLSNYYYNAKSHRYAYADGFTDGRPVWPDFVTRRILMQQFTNGVAHCSFTSAQDIAGIDAMMYWLDTGTRPDPSVFFPPALGFDPNFVPQPWPW